MHHVNHLVRLCVSVVHNLFAAGVGMHVFVVHAGHLPSMCLTVAVVAVMIA